MALTANTIDSRLATGNIGEEQGEDELLPEWSHCVKWCRQQDGVGAMGRRGGPECSAAEEWNFV